MIISFISAALPRSRAVAMCPRILGSLPYRTGLFLNKYDLYHVSCDKVKYPVYNNSVIALVQRFIFMWTNICIPIHKFVGMNAAVGPYKNKSLNSCDKFYDYLVMLSTANLCTEWVIPKVRGIIWLILAVRVFN